MKPEDRIAWMEARINALEFAFFAQVMVTNFLLKNHARRIAGSMRDNLDKVDDGLPAIALSHLIELCESCDRAGREVDQEAAETDAPGV